MEVRLDEQRRFDPSPAFAAAANERDPEVWARAAADPEAYWRAWAEQLEWIEAPTEALDWSQAPVARWFADGTLNASANCVDRHVAAGRGDVVALRWEGEDGARRDLTYADLLTEVEACAAALRRLGVQRGDRVAIYLPMVVELPVAMLACARLGAAHSVVFGGFSPQSLAERIDDAQCKVLITAAGGLRRGQVVPLKANADAAVEASSHVESVLVVRRLGAEHPPVAWTEGRDVWWDDAVAAAAGDPRPAPEAMGAEDLLFLLYTSGTTARPKGIMHTTGGYLTGVHATSRQVLDLQPGDVYWCAADIGWVTGHSYVVYGPLSCGATCVIYEGAPDWPARDRTWDVVERHGVTVLYTAPTAIRACIGWGEEHPARHDLSTLRLLGSVGEPINPEAWMWYHRVIGGERCPIVDTWWQTETGHHMASPLPGLSTCKPGSAVGAVPGVSIDVVDDEGRSVARGEAGYLVVDQPWPGMARGVWGDPQRFADTYWSHFPGRYFAGDGAKLDADGFLWLLGRVDDVMNVSGHRISTTEVESALVEHPAVSEAAVVGVDDPVSGQAVAAFVTLDQETVAALDAGADRDVLLASIRTHVGDRIGKFARPKVLVAGRDLPKTRSGKIMRRLLRDIAERRELGDTTTLADPTIVTELQAAVG